VPSPSSPWPVAPPRQVRKGHPARREKRDLPGRWVQRARRARKVRKDPSGHKAPSASAGQPALPDRQDRWDRRVRLADKAQLDPAASAARQERRDPLVQQGRRAQQVIPARRQQFALSPARTPFAVRTTRCWPVWFVRWARPRERNARRLARQQPVYVYGGDLGRPGAAISFRFLVLCFKKFCASVNYLLSGRRKIFEPLSATQREGDANARMDGGNRGRDWPDLVGRRDVQFGPRGRFGCGRDIAAC
jgi:hypothetical protein